MILFKKQQRDKKIAASAKVGEGMHKFAAGELHSRTINYYNQSQTSHS